MPESRGLSEPVHPVESLHLAVLETLLEPLGLDPQSAPPHLELAPPPNPAMGDLGLGCFILSKSLRRPPAEIASKIQGISYEEAREAQVKSIAAGRLGTPSEFGDACAFLCSAQSGYISGQNLQLDGGSYVGLV